MLKLAIILAAAAVCSGQVANNKYLLFTRDNPNYVSMTSKDTTLPDEYKPEDNTIILIHGYGGRASDDFNNLITNGILSTSALPRHNVIVVDWENEAKHSYSVASANVRQVAHELHEFLRWLSLTAVERDPTLTTTTIDPNLPPGSDSSSEELELVTTLDTVHLVGFGLGAHVAGIVGRRLQETNHVLLGRITGLDPSGSGWGSNSERLRRGDANYVEVIHTDGSGLLAHGIGTAIGHVNFYANGGSNQPGCFSHSCSHNRVYELFAASMLGRLTGSPCNSMTQMNLNLCRGTPLNMGGTELNKRRFNDIYRINTGRRYPF